jgi:membrane complex biogenesis BtpA family protein
MPLLAAWDQVQTPIIGMLHLPPLPGAPRYGGGLAPIVERLLADAEALLRGGVHGLMMENFGDAPFYPERVPVWTVAHMTHLAGEVRRRFDVPLGINVLRNDGRSALAIAHAVGAAFIRVNVLCGACVTDQGVLQGIAVDLLRDRALLDATEIKILADVNVKHAAPLGAPRPLEEEVFDTVQRGGADAVVVTGTGTGRSADVADVRAARAAAGGAPVFVGSGVTAETIGSFLGAADGFIVGSSLKEGGAARNRVDAAQVKALMARVR